MLPSRVLPFSMAKCSHAANGNILAEKEAKVKRFRLLPETSIPRFVQGKQQDGSQHKHAAQPARGSKAFLPEQPDPERAEYRFQIAGHRGAYKADALEG